MNNYFCFCKGQKCIESFDNQDCKFFFYVHIIDCSRDLYLKSDYLFVDFIFSEYSSDDAYPIFEKMIKQNYPVHYSFNYINFNLFFKFNEKKIFKKNK
jgi:hypothetical protein